MRLDRNINIGTDAQVSTIGIKALAERGLMAVGEKNLGVRATGHGLWSWPSNSPLGGGEAGGNSHPLRGRVAGGGHLVLEESRRICGMGRLNRLLI